MVRAGGRAISVELAAEAWCEADPLTDRERQVLRLAGEPHASPAREDGSEALSRADHAAAPSRRRRDLPPRSVHTARECPDESLEEP